MATRIDSRKRLPHSKPTHTVCYVTLEDTTLSPKTFFTCKRGFLDGYLISLLCGINELPYVK